MYKCDHCYYGDKYELEKPCIIIRENCKFYKEINDMVCIKREITKEIYDRAMMNNKHIVTKEDWNTVFTISESCGYGIYGYDLIEEDGKYYVLFNRGSSCD